MKANRAYGLVLGVGCAIGLVAACGGGDGSGSGGVGSGGSGASASGGSGANGSGGNGFGANGGNGFGANGGDSGLNADSACANETVTAEQIPVAMYIMLDKSGSMKGTKWSDTKAGLKTFVNDPASAGIKVALQYFLINNGQCDGTGYNTPAVPMGALPGNAPAIMNSLNATSPGGTTPTEGALRGLKQYCKSYMAQHPQEKCVGLFVTDGLPNGCDETTATLTGICSSAYSATPSESIFVMGMAGADFTLLDKLAVAGGTGPKAYDISTGGAAQFAAALQNVAGKLLSCDYSMPTTDAGTVDPGTIIINFSDSSGTSQLSQVADQAACGANGGFYYDDPTHPTKISLCPTTCDKVQGTDKGTIQILLDCTKLGPA